MSTQTTVTNEAVKKHFRRMLFVVIIFQILLMPLTGFWIYKVAKMEAYVQTWTLPQNLEYALSIAESGNTANADAYVLDFKDEKSAPSLEYATSVKAVREFTSDP